MAFRPTVQGQPLTFEAMEERLIDVETASTWTVTGFATDGPLAGQRLDAVPEAYVAFWFAWAAFHPDTELWES